VGIVSKTPNADDCEQNSLKASIERTKWKSSKSSRKVEMTTESDNPNGNLEVDGQQFKQMAELLGEAALYEEDANARIVYGTLRSGQLIETPFSLVVIGDVNPGADLIAGGDIIVFGNLRGTAHASAYDDRCVDHVIIALSMRPMQLRIGSVISRGSGEKIQGAEVARIDDRRIVVEAFNPRVLMKRK